VDVVVSTAQLVARLVQEEVTAGDLVTLLRLRGAGIAVTETTLPPGASAAGTAANEVELPDGTALTAVVRSGHVLLPERAGRLSAGDVVIALCEPGTEHVLHDALVGDAAQ
jgi:trk system potassium uptake protein TrkA